MNAAGELCLLRFLIHSEVWYTIIYKDTKTTKYITVDRKGCCGYVFNIMEFSRVLLRVNSEGVDSRECYNHDP